MDSADRNRAFAPARTILNAGKLLHGGFSPDKNLYIEINNYEEALNIARDQTGGKYSPWCDIRESEASETNGPSPLRIEFRNAWEKEMVDEIEAGLPKQYLESINDVEADIYNACSNIFFAKGNVFFEKLLELYKNGFWPCGLQGKSVEAGKIIVFNPTR